MQPKILLLSAYDADSHRRWRAGLEENLPEFSWTVLALPARHFRWRIRGNPISWQMQSDAVLRQHYDLVVCTSMVDIATVRGLYPNLAATPLVVYFHENQFAFPRSNQQHHSIDPAMVNIYSAMAADIVLFNSAFNQDTFFDGLRKLIAKLPEPVKPAFIEEMRAKCQVICVPLEQALFVQAKTAPKPKNRQLTLVWNHRVEYDKGIEELKVLLTCCMESKLDFRLILLGQRFRRQPGAWAELVKKFQQHIMHDGYANSRESYYRLLSASDVVLSTALHEFQGLAVMEACVFGCIPLVPKRLSYPEYLPAANCYQTPQEAVERLQAIAVQDASAPRAPAMESFGWPQMAGSYRHVFKELLAY